MTKPEIMLVEPMMPRSRRGSTPTTPSTASSTPTGRDAALRPAPRSAPWSPAAAPVSAATGSRRCPRSASSPSTASAPIKRRPRPRPVSRRRRYDDARRADRGRGRYGHGADARACCAGSSRATASSAPAVGLPARASRSAAACAARRLGILGLGQIGQALARRADVFGMDVRYWDRAAIAGRRSAAAPRSAVALAGESDVLADLRRRQLQRRRGIVDADLLAALGSDGLVINIARGSVVNEPDLIAALAPAASPPPASTSSRASPASARSSSRCRTSSLTPHQASATVETRIAMGEAVLANLAAHFAGARPPALVN